MSKRFPYPDGFTLSDLNDLIARNVDYKINRAWGIFGAVVNEFRGHPEDAAPPLKALDLDGLGEEWVDKADPITLEEIQGHLAEAPFGAAAIVSPVEIFAWVRIFATVKKYAPEVYALLRKLIDVIRKGD